MKQFIKKLLYFLLLVILAYASIILWPVSKKKQYNYLTGDYIKSSWVYSRIFEDNRDIDIAFIGTSHTFNGVMDSLIESRLNQKLDTNLHIANIAQNNIGRNLQYAVIKDLYKKKSPDLLVIEVREIESYHGHMYFPILADGSDVLVQPALINLDYLSNISEYLQFKGKLLKLTLGDKKTNIAAKQTFSLNSKYGFEKNYENVNEEEFNRIVAKRNRRIIYKLNKPLINLSFKYSYSYLNKITQLAEQHNTKIVFLYLPYSGVKTNKPLANDYYLKQGPIWMPTSILSDKENFINPTHLNEHGALLLSEWLSDKLIDKYILLKKP